MSLSYILSLHIFPAVAGATAAAANVFLCYQSWKWSLLYLTAGVGVSKLIFFFSPLPTLAPVGGTFHVGVREMARGSGGDDVTPPVTLFYPTRTPCRKPVQWLPFDDQGYARGMAAYVGVPAFLLKDMRYVKTAMTPNAPCESLFLPDGSARPLFLFSHGLAGYAQLYTALLLNLAARGVIVAAMTHMDASAAYCRDARGNFSIPLDTTRKWDADDREPQLRQRISETQTTMARLQRTGELLLALGHPPEEVRRYVALRPKMVLVGHSFGAATVLATALAAETAPRETVAAVVALDPWHIPLHRSLFLEPIQKGQLRYTAPTLCHFSETWYVWKEVVEFFDQVTKAVRSQAFTADEKRALEDAADKNVRPGITGEPGWFTNYKCGGTDHLSYTDMFALNPVVFKKTYCTQKPIPFYVNLSNQIVRYAEQQLGPVPNKEI